MTESSFFSFLGLLFIHLSECYLAQSSFFFFFFFNRKGIKLSSSSLHSNIISLCLLPQRRIVPCLHQFVSRRSSPSPLRIYLILGSVHFLISYFSSKLRDWFGSRSYFSLGKFQHLDQDHILPGGYAVLGSITDSSTQCIYLIHRSAVESRNEWEIIITLNKKTFFD